VAVPRVSQDYLDARRRQILQAARRCFARDGFHTTSMQDILAESGLSAGAVYRYFPAKADIAEAIATEATGLVTSLILSRGRTADPPSPADLLGEIMSAVESLDDEENLTGLAMQVWGEALRSPAMAKVVEHGMAQVEAAVSPVVEAYQQRNEIDPAVPAGDVARLFIVLIQGFIVQHNLGRMRADEFRRSIEALASRRPPAPRQPDSASHPSDTPASTT
jgi:AcrR family transcriptional regulator